MKKALIILSAAALLSACSTTQKTPQTPTIPVTKVVMYQSGVGYVERVGEVNSDSIALNIRTDQINDILKSLTIIDRSNGHPVSVTLPVDKASLRTAQIPEGGLMELISAFRGSHVTVDAKGSGKIEGRIVGIESNEEIGANNTIVQNYRITVIDDKSSLHLINYTDINSVRIHDPNLADGIGRSLDISLNEGDWKQIELSIQLDGAKKRDVVLSYIVAMPTWKPAYRLVLSDDGKSVLQGWAVVSNVTGADWKDINFSLVSGQPMSFTYDLYTPQFLNRPDLSYRAQHNAIAPKIQSSGYGAGPSPSFAAAYAQNMAEEAMEDAAPAKSKSGSARKRPARPPRALIDMDIEDFAVYADTAANKAEAYDAVTYDEIVSQDFGSKVDTDQIGTFDAYIIKNALTVKDGSTAMVNLLQHELPAREVRLFDVSTSSNEQNESWQTIELKNDADVALEPGPITIYRGSTFVGEGYLTRTAPGATAHLTFAAESRVALKTSSTMHDDNYMLTNISHGIVSYTYDRIKTYSFSARSNAAEQLSVMAQIPREGCLEPVDFPEDSVMSKDTIAVPIKVDAKQTASVAYNAVCKRNGRISLESIKAVESIENALEKGYIPEDQAESMRQYTVLFREDLSLNDQIVVKDALKTNLETDQSEITASLHDLKNVKTASANKLREQLIERQRKNEKQIAELAEELTELRIRLSENSLALKALIRTLTFSIR